MAFYIGDIFKRSVVSSIPVFGFFYNVKCITDAFEAPAWGDSIVNIARFFASQVVQVFACYSFFSADGLVASASRSAIASLSLKKDHNTTNVQFESGPTCNSLNVKSQSEVSWSDNLLCKVLVSYAGAILVNFVAHGCIDFIKWIVESTVSEVSRFVNYLFFGQEQTDELDTNVVIDQVDEMGC